MYKNMTKSFLRPFLANLDNFDQLSCISENPTPIDVTIRGKLKSFQNQSFIYQMYKNPSNMFEIIEKLIKSIVFYMEGIECFTYFSGLQHYWN